MIHDFLVTDPLFDARNAVLKVLWNRGGPIIIIVTLAFPEVSLGTRTDLAAQLRPQVGKFSFCLRR